MWIEIWLTDWLKNSKQLFLYRNVKRIYEMFTLEQTRPDAEKSDESMFCGLGQHMCLLYQVKLLLILIESLIFSLNAHLENKYPNWSKSSSSTTNENAATYSKNDRLILKWIERVTLCRFKKRNKNILPCMVLYKVVTIIVFGLLALDLL